MGRESTVSDGPLAVYVRRKAERQREAHRVARANDRLSTARLLTFVGGIVLTGMLFHYEIPAVIGVATALAAVALFITLVVLHTRGKRHLDRLQRAIAHYDWGCARIEDRWRGKGITGVRYRDPNHLYAEDLDLFGEGSLFELLATARTRMGERAIASWLNGTASPDEIRVRQEAIEELRDELDLREDLAVIGGEVQEELDPEAMMAWSTEPRQFERNRLRRGAYGLSIVMILAIVASQFHGALLTLPMLLYIIELLVLQLVRKRLETLLSKATGLGRHLTLLRLLLARIEESSLQSPRLVALRERLGTAGDPPTREIARLARLIALFESATRNAIVALVAVIILGPIHIAYALEAWWRRVGPHIPQWLETVGEFEALQALGGYAYEHPDDPFPQIVESGPLFDGKGLEHPLIPRHVSVPNDVTLGAGARLILVSGSNMSGKSTLLRTVGINIVLAQAGAPVRAASLRLSPLSIGCSIHILDSLRDGQSRFFAEMARLRDIIHLLDNDRSVLFLLDELMHGTNSGDRRIGAEVLLRRLVDAGAIGLVTTHDLALAEIATSLGARAQNAHFTSHFADGCLQFDYRMRPGVVKESNALDIMMAFGLLESPSPRRADR